MRKKRYWLGVAVAAAITAVLVPGASADTFEVTRTGDPVPGPCKPRDCSLREAVLKANETVGADVVVLPNRRRAYELTRAGAGEDAGATGDLDVNSDPLRLTHPGKGRATIDGNALDRVLHIQAGAPTALTRIGVTGGFTDGDGGGILSNATLTLERSRVGGNVGDDGGGIDLDSTAGLVLRRSAVAGNEAVDNLDSNGGGLNAGDPGTLIRIVRSTVGGNHAIGNGGGIDGAGGATIRLLRSTLAGNRSEEDGGGLHSANPSEIRIVASTISGNRADGSPSDGGGMYFDSPTVTITNSTVHGNRTTGTGGGIHARDGANLSLNAVTVARNVADTDQAGIAPLAGGGLYRLSSLGFDVRNSLIALNGQGPATFRQDCAGDTPFDSLGNNLLSTTNGGGCQGFDQPSDRVRANPKLGKLARNGGPTKTVALKAGSPAIGAAHRASAPGRDQRGRRRDRRPDIGSFERGA